MNQLLAIRGMTPGMLGSRLADLQYESTAETMKSMAAAFYSDAVAYRERGRLFIAERLERAGNAARKLAEELESVWEVSEK